MDSAEGFLAGVRARSGHFRLESGHHGDFWMDLETLCRRPRQLRPWADQIAARLARHDVDAVCGPLVEGAYVALMVAAELDCDFTYAERFLNPQADGLFPVEYRLPNALHDVVRGKRVAIVNDVISAGSAVRGAFGDLQSLGATVVAIGALLVLGDPIRDFARERGVPIETLVQHPYNMWTPEHCPLCAAGTPLDIVAA
ncbi:MAG: orotate phosphoribosyltransferase [Vicinamibacterales bacterium]